MDFLVLTDIHNRWVHLETMISLAGDLDGVIFLGDLLMQGSEREAVSSAIRSFSKIHEAAKFTVGVPGNGAIPELVKCLDEIGVSVHGKSFILDDIGFFGVGGTPDTVSTVLTLRAFFKSEIRPAIELHEKALETLSVFGVTVRNDVFMIEDWSEAQVKALERFRGPFDHTEEEIHDILIQWYESMSDCSVRVLLSHIPPYEPILNPKFPEGVSTGSKGIADFIHEYRPSVVLSGHYHISHEFKIG
ncbi:MAG: hypothetical protein E4H14_19360, partial [Candidatus Thorarchaeota archaeon]